MPAANMAKETEFLMWQMYVGDSLPLHPVKNTTKDTQLPVRWSQWAQRISSLAFAVLMSEVQRNNLIR